MRLAWEWGHLAVALVVVGVALAAHVVLTRAAAPSSGPGPAVLARALVVLFIPLWVVVFLERTAPTDGPLVVAAACLAAFLMFGAGWNLLRLRPAGGRGAAPAFLAATGILAALVSVGNETGIDVLMFQEVAAERLLAGANPYEPGYPLVYGDGQARFFYGPELVSDDELTFGFPYPPVSLLLAVPGAVLGDVRISHVAAVVAVGWLMLSTGGGAWHARAAVVLLLASPMTYLVTYRSWTEIFLVLALAAVVWAHTRGWRVRDVLFGILLVSKQYALGLAPLYLLLLRRPWIARSTVMAFGRAASVAVVVTLPWVLWDPGAFWRSMVELLVLLPFRPDSMSVLVMASEAIGWPPPGTHSAIGIAAAGAVLAMVLVLAPRTARGFTLGVALVLSVLFLFSKQAFANYYFVVLGAVLLAAAVPLPAEDAASRRRPATSG